jgi:hypothetical protein
MNLSPDTLALLMRILQRGRPQQPMNRMGVSGAMPQQPQAPQQFQRLPQWIGVRG